MSAVKSFLKDWGVDEWLPKLLVVFFFFAWWTGIVPAIIKWLPEPKVEDDGIVWYLQIPVEKRDVIRGQLEKILQEAKDMGTDYGSKDFHNDMHRIAGIELEEGVKIEYGTYRLYEDDLFNQSILNRRHFTEEDIDSRILYDSPLRHWNQCPGKIWDKVVFQDGCLQWKPEINVEATIRWLNGDFPTKSACLRFLVLAYLKTLLGATLLYALRFRNGWRLSLTEELMLCPGRFVLSVLLWPKYILDYPQERETEMAKYVRYARIKAAYLQTKEGISQLTQAEEDFLWQQAAKPVVDFKKLLVSLAEAEKVQIRRTLAVSYLVLLIGIFLWPATSLAKPQELTRKEKQAVCSLHQLQLDDCRKARDGPNTDDDYQVDLAICNTNVWQPIFLVVNLLFRYLLRNDKGVLKKIDHIPLYGYAGFRLSGILV